MASHDSPSLQKSKLLSQASAVASASNECLTRTTSTGNLATVPPLPGTQMGLHSWLQDPQNTSFSAKEKNCPPPTGMPGYVVVENIRKCIHHFGQISLFKAYLEINDNQSSKRILRSELQSSGVSLTDTPHNGRKDAADKMMMVDMLAFAIDNPPPAVVVLISGDRDFVYALSTLRNRRYTIVLVVPNRGAPIILRSQANALLEWRYDVLNQDIWTQQQQQAGIVTLSSNESTPSDPEKSRSLRVQTVPVASGTSGTTMMGYNVLSSNSIPTTSSDGSDVISPPAKNRLLATVEYEGYVFSPKAPGFFDLLVEVLELFRMQGEEKPRRSKVGNELIQRNPLLYNRAGCSTFKEYVELAVKEGIITVGGDKGHAWMSLNEGSRDKVF